MKTRHKLLSTVISSLIATSTAMANTDSYGSFDYSAWLRANYANGDRYDYTTNGDGLGVSQAAVKVRWSNDDFAATLLVGANNLFNDDIGGKRNVDIKNASVAWYGVGSSDITLSAGLQPLLFGLKPNGFKGDRSIQPSIEYGGTRALSVSRQACPSIIASVPVGEFSVRGGFFDINSSTENAFYNNGLGDISGSSLDKNYFAQVNYQPGDGQGFYATVGIEGYYIGGLVDSTQPIYDFGLGFRHGALDISLEQIYLDAAITNTPSDETYTVAEVSFQQSELMQWYVDYAQADQLDSSTYRVGFIREITPYLFIQLEYAKDELGFQGGLSEDSIELRMEVRI